MDKHYHDKVIWITGASSGIGEALALELAGRGARLILSARRESVLAAVRDRMSRTAKQQTVLLPFDLTHSAELGLVAEKALAAFGHLDMVILNGGIAQRSLARKTGIDVDREIMEVDYFANVSLTKHLLPHFMERNKGGIVVVSSVMGFIGTPFRSGYAAAKHALHGFYDSLRAELWHKHRGVSVTLVCPGWVRTNITLNALAGDGRKLNEMDPTTANGMDPQDFARNMLRGVAAGKAVLVIGGWKERMAVWMQRFTPGLFRRFVRTAKVR